MPLNLENVLRDPRYANVKFVLIHGGYPYTLDMIWLTAAKNVYTRYFVPMGYYAISLAIQKHSQTAGFLCIPRK